MESEEKVIRPPMEPVIVSGRVFRPSSALRNKEWLVGILLAVSIWVMCILGWLGVGWIISLEDGNGPAFQAYVNDWWIIANLGVWIFNAVWLIPLLVLTPLHIGSMEYSVTAETGEALPEVYVKKGIFNVTRKHVPFRTITNISSKAGPFDRIFKIGNVLIETAGASGSTMGPEEKIEGIRFYEEVRDFILRELRGFKQPYVTTTETIRPYEEPVPRMEGTFDDEILITLREIRDVLKRVEKKLGSEVD